MAEAKLNREYVNSRLGVGAFMVACCVWSLYDGLVGWPQKNAAMEKARPLLLGTNLTVTAWIAQDDNGDDALVRLFRQTGGNVPGKLIGKIKELELPSTLANDTISLERQSAQLRKLFEAPVYSDGDVQTQWWQAGITMLLGLLAFAAIGRKANMRFIADDHGMSGNGFGPQTLAYEDITAINWAKWAEKGIIVLTFNSGKAVKLDGWHFSGMKGIADEIRKHRPDLAPDAPDEEVKR